MARAPTTTGRLHARRPYRHRASSGSASRYLPPARRAAGGRRPVRRSAAQPACEPRAGTGAEKRCPRITSAPGACVHCGGFIHAATITSVHRAVPADAFDVLRDSAGPGCTSAGCIQTAARRFRSACKVGAVGLDHLRSAHQQACRRRPAVRRSRHYVAVLDRRNCGAGRSASAGRASSCRICVETDRMSTADHGRPGDPRGGQKGGGRRARQSHPVTACHIDAARRDSIRSCRADVEAQSQASPASVEILDQSPVSICTMVRARPSTMARSAPRRPPSAPSAASGGVRHASARSISSAVSSDRPLMRTVTGSATAAATRATSSGVSALVSMSQPLCRFRSAFGLPSRR